MKTDKRVLAILFALLAATLYGLSTPFSKVFLSVLSPAFLSGLLYFGAGIGMLMVNLVKNATVKNKLQPKLSHQDRPFIFGMIILDIMAPISLMIGLRLTTAANASLLNNFEIVATAIIAMMIFKEKIGKKMTIAIIIILAGSLVLSFEDITGFRFSLGSLLVLVAATLWGLENNFTRKLSVKDPMQVVVIKGFGSGVGSLLIAGFLGEIRFDSSFALYALLLGFFAYGLSIFFYVSAQRELGAARTATYYAAAPFIGALVAFLVLQEALTIYFVIGLILMIVGTAFALSENREAKSSNKKR